ncbi:MAG: FecR domain-containing protein [Chloroflexi bacterium]|nr:FecR domain-containing protein [Chloroflexota bacterium]
MLRRRIWIIGIALVTVLLVSAFVVAQPVQGTEATLVISTGEATVIQPGAVPLVSSKSSVSVSAGQALAVYTGDKISLGKGSIGELRLYGGSVVDLAGGTSLEVTELNTNENTYRVRLNLLAGRTMSRVVKALGIGDAFEIRTPSSTASVRGTVFTVAVIAPDATYFSCDEGVVHIVMGDQNVDIYAGEEVDAVVGRPLLVRLQTGPEPTAVPAPITRLAPTPQPTPTAIPAPIVRGKSADKAVSEVIVAAANPIISKDPLAGPTTDANNPAPSDTPDPEKDKPENLPNSPSQVPGNTPADTPGNGNPPDAGGIPPGQGGTPPGQENKPPNDNNGNGGGGGKKD